MKNTLQNIHDIIAEFESIQNMSDESKSDYIAKQNCIENCLDQLGLKIKQLHKHVNEFCCLLDQCKH